MKVADVAGSVVSHAGAQGLAMHSLMSELYPICRSITGDGVRRSLRLLQKLVPLELREVPTGVHIFDWEVPKEWNIRDAYIKDRTGRRIIDFRASNLHVVSYSIPFEGRMSLDKLREHLFSMPQAPDWIPYRTSYYRETWGFCLSHRQMQALTEQDYEVRIDSSLEPGSMTYGELRIQGSTDDEVLISAHCCHPSLCNDNLSSLVVAAQLAQFLARRPRRFSYRFLWVPGTIGSLAWLSANESVLPKVRHGLVLSCVGDSGPFTYKRSRQGVAEIDRVVEHVLQSSGISYVLRDFRPFGCDERQYCSPGINLPVGCFMRTPNEEYQQNHTSADNLDFVTAAALEQSYKVLCSVVDVLEENRRYLNLSPKGEPQLGRRGLYSDAGGKSGKMVDAAVMWLLNLSDGEHSLLDIAARSGLAFAELCAGAELLERHNLLRKCD